jgi:hypothetical protein
LTLIQWLRSKCPQSTPTSAREAVRNSFAWWYRNDLNRLAQLFCTDKWGAQWYTQHYDRYFRSMKTRRLNILEIGVGGYLSSTEGATSLRMWKAYCRKSKIVGIDLYAKSSLSEHRIEIRQCDQTDSAALTRLSTEIIIDDGSHLNEHVFTSFQFLCPLLRPNGIYAVEDIQTAYWPTWGGGVGSPNSSMAFFRSLVDGLNHAEYPIAGYEPGFFDRHIVEISFFHNLVIIQKGQNDERTNFLQFIEHELANLTKTT